MSLKERTIELHVEEGVKATRVDRYIASVRTDLSRSLITKKGTVVTVNNKVVKNSSKVNENDVITLQYKEEVFDGIDGEDIPLHILYEDNAMLVINKEQGMVVHPAAGNWSGTLVNALVHRYGNDFESTGDLVSHPEESPLEEEDEMSDEEYDLDPLRPGIVHRLDKDTSGTMVVALNRIAHRNLADQFRLHTNTKIYLALCKGVFTHKRGKIDTNINRSSRDRKKYCVCESKKGKTAHTQYLVLRQYADYALVRIEIHTGRTHQIRVHMSSIGHPIIGDPIYGKKDKNFPNASLMLHAFILGINQPYTGEKMLFRAAMPQRFKDLIGQIMQR